MTIEQAKSIKLTDYLNTLGCTPCKQQNNNVWYLSPFRSEKAPSFKINLNRNEWYDFGLGKGGNILSFVMELHHSTVSEALQILSNKTIVSIPFSFRQPTTNKNFEEIVVKPLTNPALIGFLQKRHIPIEIAAKYCKEIHYKLGGKSYFAVAFENNSKGYEMRNPYFKGCIAPKDITLLSTGSTTCCLFEGFIDMLSYLVYCQQHGINSESYDLLVLSSTSNLTKAISLLGSYESIQSYLDNDEAGQQATTKLQQRFGSKLIDKSEIYWGYKDLNDFLAGQASPAK